MMRQWKFVAGLVVGLVFAGAVYAQQSKTKLTADDYAEIQQLYARYAWSVDTHDKNGATYATMFVPDGEFFLNGERQAAGSQKLAEMMAGKPGSPSHVTTNIMIQPTPDGARGFAYLGVSGGTYEDVLVKTREGWRFKQRKLNLKTLPPTSPFSN